MNYIQLKLNAIIRYGLWHMFSKKLGLIQIVEYPKSGGTWMTQLVSDYLDLYYPRNVIPKFKKSVIHAHYLYSDHFNKIIFVTRDGRDIMVSYYFHLLIGNDRSSNSITNHFRKKMPFSDYENVEKNLPSFITYLHTDYLKRFNRHSWSEFVTSYQKNRDKVCIIQYEDILKDTQKELIRALEFVGEQEINEDKLLKTINKFSFKTQTNRKPGEENSKSFLRKGISGDWKNYFTKQSAEVFNKYAGKTLINLGYEKDSSWINNLNK